ncbi:hypothetical protein DCC81_11995 [Chitinophaga parva]|uniref:Bacteriophage tail tape measure N-terminal domain-containing protein n=1 Tax=Chitinophaga parva TaxID=2169414 RepID=A0A2T7BFH1_9BACT|nr:hypothetical protein [Chitinophaga parva]PUZ25029.1 hypothetical protein DCC81_11995 [Chitinophaga parva]
MGDIIDVVTRLSYETNPTGLQTALSLVTKNREEIERLEKEVKQLGADYARTAATDIQTRQKIMDQINAHQRTIKGLNAEIDKEIVSNKELSAVLEKEIGTIGLLTKKLEVLERARKEATDPADIGRYNQAIKQAQEEISKLKNLTPPPQPGQPTPPAQPGNKANVSGVYAGLNNIVRDAPFGIIGISNNITQLTDAWALLGKETEKTGGATKAFFSGLLGSGGIALGISLITTYLTTLAQKYGSLGTAIDVLTGEMTVEEKAHANLISTLEKGAHQYASAVENVDELRNHIKLAKDGFIDKDKVVKEYNDTIGRTVGQVKSLDEAEQSLVKNADAYLKFMFLKTKATAAYQLASEEAKKSVVEQAKTDKESVDYIFSGALQSSDTAVANLAKKNAKSNRDQASKEYEENQKAYEKFAKEAEDAAAAISKKYGFNFLEDRRSSGAEHQIENVYAQKLQEMKAQLAAITAATFQSDDTITAKVRESIAKTNADIDNLLKDKKLTTPQAAILKALAGDIGNAQLSKELTEYHDKIIDAQRKLNSELARMAEEDADKHVALIVDDFDRQNAQIDNDLAKQKDVYARALDDMLKENEDKRKEGLLGRDPFSNDVIALANAARIRIIFGKLLDNLQADADQKKQRLALSLFDIAGTFDKTYYDGFQAQISEQLAPNIEALTKRFLDGEITYKKYQDELTKITEDGEAKRRQINLRALQDELDLQERKLQAAKLTATSDDEQNAIQDKIAQLRKQIADLQAEIAKATGQAQNTVDTKDKERRDKTISGFRTMSDAGVSAYRTILQAQIDQVDRSISIEQQRVDRVQAIADRGNAKALQQEEQRLNQLQKQREKYARAMLAINAAQTLSESVLAIASAAGESGAGAIVIVPAVIAALAAGFGIVKGLAGDNTVNLAKGRVGLQGPGTTTSDSIPANLSRGESVITADATAHHRNILEGMNKGTRYELIDRNRIAAVQLAPVPTLQRTPINGIVQAPGAGGMGNTKEVEKRLDRVERAVRAIPGTVLHLDEHGLSARVTQVQERNEKMRRL